MIRASAAALAAALLLPGTSALAVTIDFDSLPGNTIITNQFPEATFTSTAGFQVRTLAIATTLGSSPPNAIGVFDLGGTLDGNQNLFVTFAFAVDDLSFKIVGANSANPGVVDVFDAGGLAGTVNLLTDSDGFTADIVDLSTYTGVTSITVRNVTDFLGIGYDDFTFVAARISTPEPASMALLGVGLLALAARRRLG